MLSQMQINFLSYETFVLFYHNTRNAINKLALDVNHVTDIKMQLINTLVTSSWEARGKSPTLQAIFR